MDADRVPTTGMNDALWLTRRSAGVEDEQRIFRVHLFRRTEIINPFLDGIIVHLHLRVELQGGTVPAQHHDSLDTGGVSHGLIDDTLECDGFSPPVPDISRDHDLRFRIPDPGVEGLGPEPCIDDGMDRTYPCTGEEGDDMLRDQRHVQAHTVSFRNAESLQPVRQPHDGPQQLPVGEDLLTAVFTPPDQGQFVPPSVLHMPVKAVRRDVEAAAGEPAGIGVVPGENPVPGFHPVKFACLLIPEPVRVIHEPLVGLPVIPQCSLLQGGGIRKVGLCTKSDIKIFSHRAPTT